MFLCEATIMPELVSQERDDVLIVGFASQTIVADSLVDKVGREFLKLVDVVGPKLLLDFRGVKHISSAMINQILLLHQNCASAKVRLKLCNLNPEIKEVLTTTGLNKLLSVHDTQAEALAAFDKKRWFWQKP
jgi:anti-sigma B factor antagonist